MSTVKFDVESDGRFQASVIDLGTSAATRILLKLKMMSECISWATLIRDYGWHEIAVTPTDCFPGANRLYSFVLHFSPVEAYEILAYNYAPPEAVCVLARVTKLRQ
ncbi:MAG TPA: hypothetical protein VFX55_03295 [Duganella sp.]|nr:hypothetical protein [Duganella sp.]